jgi:hypothetical protein
MKQTNFKISATEQNVLMFKDSFQLNFNLMSFRCIALAPPPVYRSESTLPANLTDNIEIFIHNNDCVPSLSLGVVAKLVESMQEVSDLDFSVHQVIMMRAGLELPTTQENVDIIAETLEYVSKSEKIKGNYNNFL